MTVEIRALKESQKNAVLLAEFRRWLTVTLDIRGFSYPLDVLETEVRDLILDPDFHGRVYLKGMRLPCSRSGLKQYRFAYNFLHGKVNRDRRILVDRDKEANIVRRI